MSESKKRRVGGVVTNGFVQQFQHYYFIAVSVQFIAGQFLVRRLLTTSDFQRVQRNGHLVLQSFS